MLQVSKAYSTSQKSPQKPCLRHRKIATSIYQHAFLEDFCCGFSFNLAENTDYASFYDVEPENASLKKWLTFAKHDFLRYGLDDVFSHFLHTLVFSGKAFAEVVSSYDKSGKLVGISFVPFDPIISIRCFKRTYFVAIQNDKKPKFFNIRNQNIIVLRSSDVGFSRYYLSRFYKRLRKFDVTNVSDMTFSSAASGFDFMLWRNRTEHQLLKCSKKLGWHGRISDAQHLGDAYVLFRSIRFKMLRKKFLEYFLLNINQAVSEICETNGSRGTIVAKTVCHKYDELLEKLSAGEMNYTQLQDYVFLK